MLRTKVPGGNELINSEWLLKEKAGLTYGMKVGDFGCGGGGYFVLQAARIVGEKGEVYAVDILKSVLSNVISRARSLGIGNVLTVWSNLEVAGATKIGDGTLDLGLLINILFQNKDARAIMKEAVRMIRHSGRLLVVDWKEGRFPLGPEEEDKVPVRAVRDVAASLGLKETEFFDAGLFHYGILFVRI